MLVGNGLDFKMGRSLKYKKVPHNRLLLALAHGMGHQIDEVRQPEPLRWRGVDGFDLTRAVVNDVERAVAANLLEIGQTGRLCG